MILDFLPKDALVVNDEETTEAVTVVLEIDTVILGNLVRQIAEDGDIERPEAALLSGYIGPGQVGKMRVHRAGDHLSSKSPGIKSMSLPIHYDLDGDSNLHT